MLTTSLQAQTSCLYTIMYIELYQLRTVTFWAGWTHGFGEVRTLTWLIARTQVPHHNAAQNLVAGQGVDQIQTDHRSEGEV